MIDDMVVPPTSPLSGLPPFQDIVVKYEVSRGLVRILPEEGKNYVRQVGPLLAALYQRGQLRIVSRYYDVDATGWVTIATLSPSSLTLCVHPSYQHVLQSVVSQIMGAELPPAVVNAVSASQATGSAVPVQDGEDMLSELLEEIDAAGRWARVVEILFPYILGVVPEKDRARVEKEVEAVRTEGQIYVMEQGELRPADDVLLQKKEKRKKKEGKGGE